MSARPATAAARLARPRAPRARRRAPRRRRRRSRWRRASLRWSRCGVVAARAAVHDAVQRDHAAAAPRGHHPPAGADKGLDPALIAAVIYAESKFRDQTSHAGARGPDADHARRPRATSPSARAARASSRATSPRRRSTSPTAPTTCATCSTATAATRCSRSPPTTRGEGNVDRWIAGRAPAARRLTVERHPVPRDARLRRQRGWRAARHRSTYPLALRRQSVRLAPTRL